MSAVRDKFCIISHSVSAKGGREEEEAGSSSPGQNNTFRYQNTKNGIDHLANAVKISIERSILRRAHFSLSNRLRETRAGSRT